MDFDDEESGFGLAIPPALVCLTPFTPSVSPSPRRLSSCFTPPNKPAVRAKKQLVWVSLQGRLVGAEEATSAKTIDTNGAFTVKEAAAWELFTPIQRVLTVAAVAAATANSKKNQQILNLQKSIQLRDQVLLSMQQKLDNLCEQVNYFKDQPEVVTQSDIFVTKRVESDCNLCQPHNLPSSRSSFTNAIKELNGGEVFEYKMLGADPEERRMSDLSDWAPSVASSVDIQLDSFSTENEINSLRKECEEKDVTIKALSTFIQSSEVLGSKRIVDLEEIIRRKNMIINKLRKDIIILEQKVMNITRLRRRSFPAPCSNVQHLTIMTDNVLYDMESSTGSSSSDSDSSPKNHTQALALKKQDLSLQISEKPSKGDLKCGQTKSNNCKERNKNLHTTTPLIQNSLNETPKSAPPLQSTHATFSSGENRIRRRLPPKSKEVTAHKRWI